MTADRSFEDLYEEAYALLSQARPRDLRELRQMFPALLDAANDPDEHGRVAFLRVIVDNFELGPDDGEATFDAAVEAHQHDDEYLTSLAVEMSEYEFFGMAERAFRQVASLDETSAIAQFNLGTCLFHSGQTEEALVCLQRAARLSPDTTDPVEFELDLQLRIAECLRLLGRYADEADVLEQLASKQPHDADVWIQLAIARCENGEADRAQEAYWKAAEHEPENVSLHYNWLITAAREEWRDQIGECVEILQRLAPGDWRTIAGRASLLEADAKPAEAMQEAIAAYDAACELDDDRDQDRWHRCAALGSALSFAIRLDRIEDAQPLIQRMFDNEDISEAVLDSFRALGGSAPVRVSSYYIVLEGELFYRDRLNELRPDYDPGTRFGYTRDCLVYARSEPEAAEIALSFERSVGSPSPRIEEVEHRGDPCEDHPGVWYWSPTVLTWPFDEDDSGADTDDDGADTDDDGQGDDGG